MLPSKMLLSQLRRAGRDAAYHGAVLDDCPYTTPNLKEAWEKGWKLGDEDRRHDLARGTHPCIELSFKLPKHAIRQHQ